MIGIRIQKGEWMDEIPDTDPVPALEHVYVYMLMELGPPDLSWLLRTTGPRAKVVKIRDSFDLSFSSQQLILQFHNWHDREKRLKIRTP